MAAEKIYFCEQCDVTWKEEDVSGFDSPHCILCGSENMLVGHRFSGEDQVNEALSHVEEILEDSNGTNNDISG